MHKAFRDIYNQEGLRGFYRGYSITLVTTPMFHSLYFALYEKTKEALLNSPRFEENSLSLISIASGFAGAVCNFVTNPFWLVRTRMMSEIFRSSSESHYDKQYKGVLQAMRKIAAEEGVLALYTGFAASMLGLSHVVVYFCCYEKMKLHF